MPGVTKLYRVQAFLFDCDQPDAESHWQEWSFDVQGLSSLPDALRARVEAFLGPLAHDTVHVWTIKRLPMLRNSLSYHAGEQGVTGFPVTTVGGKTYKIRVFAHGPPPVVVMYDLTTTLHHEHDQGPTLATWQGHNLDLLSAIGEARHLVGVNLLALPDWNLRKIVARIRSSFHHGGNGTQVVFMSEGMGYVVKFSVERRAGN